MRRVSSFFSSWACCSEAAAGARRTAFPAVGRQPDLAGLVADLVRLSDWAGRCPTPTRPRPASRARRSAVIPNSAIGPTLGADPERGDRGQPAAPAWTTGSAVSRPAGATCTRWSINDLETANQRRDYARWQNVREIELTDPVAAKALLDQLR